MDPSRIQSEPSNDAGSLESAGSLADPQSLNTPDNTLDAPASNADMQQPLVVHQAPGMAANQKRPFWQRLKNKSNIYLLFFIIVLITAILVTWLAVSRNKEEAADQSAITSQDLSDGTAEQLANSATNIGSPKQILTVSSNAIFAGSVLMKNNMEIAGAVKIGGDLTLPNIVISGDSKLGNVQADKLAVGGQASFQGAISGLGGASISGKSTFTDLSTGQLTTGSIQLNGDLKLTHHIVAGGPIPSLARGNALGGGGTASVSGSDTAGSVNISTGNAPPAGCFATITFEKAFANTPHIIITPVGSPASALAFYITRSTSNFSICTSSTPPSGASFGFDYMAVE